MLVVHDPRTLAHAVPAGFPERPERVAAIVRALVADPRFELREASVASSDEAALTAVEAVHEPRYVERFRRSLEKVAALPCDVLLAPHPFGAAGKTCRGYAAEAMERLDRRLAEEGGGR